MNRLFIFIGLIGLFCFAFKASAQIQAERISATPSDDPVQPGAVVIYQYEGLLLDGPQYRWSVTPPGDVAFMLELDTKTVEITWSGSPEASQAVVHFQFYNGEFWQDLGDPYIVNFASVCEPGVVISGPDSEACTGNVVIFNLLNTNNPQNYQWNAPGGAIQLSPLGVLHVIYTNPGSYLVSVTNTQAICFSEPAPFTVTVQDQPVFIDYTTSVSQGCVNDIQRFEVNVLGDFDDITWEEQPLAGGPYLDPVPVSASSADIRFLQTTEFTANGYVTLIPKINGCVVEEADPIQIVINNVPANVTSVVCPTEICEGVPTYFEVDALNTTEFSWSITPAGTVTQEQITSDNSKLLLSSNVPGIKNVTVTPLNNGCEGDPLNFSFEVIEERKRASVEFGHDPSGPEDLQINSCRERSSHCTETLVKLDLFGQLDVGEIYDWGQSDFTIEAQFQLQGFDDQDNSLFVYTVDFSIDKDRPRQQFHKAITTNLDAIRTITVTPTPSSYVYSNLVDSDSVRLFFYYEEEREIDASAANLQLVEPVPDGELIGNEWQQTFSWRIVNPDECYRVPQYEFQLVRMYEGQMVEVNDSWPKALSIFTESEDPTLTLTIPEGSGEYRWQVRPIGSLSGGITNPLNLTDKWASTTSSITLENPDGNTNWIYSRTFTEGNKTSEQLTFANGLQQVQQQQTKVGDRVIVTETYQDYAGRDAVSTLPYPQIGVNNKLGRKASSYGAVNFDQDPLNPDGLIGNGYYSGVDLAEGENVINPDVPSAAQFPYTRTIFMNDGTGRVKEQGGVGGTHKVNGKSVRTFYTGAEESDLVMLFGEEAPEAANVHKIVTMDANDVASVSYQNKDGKVLVTALSKSAGGENLLPVTPSPDITTYTKVDGASQLGPFTLSTVKPLLYTTDREVEVFYNITPAEIASACEVTCQTCNYQVEIWLHRDSPRVGELESELLGSLPVDMTQACGTSLMLSIDHEMSFPAFAGLNYTLEKRVYADNTLYVNTETDDYLISIDAQLAPIQAFLDANNIDGLYSHLFTTYGCEEADGSCTIPLNCGLSVVVPMPDICEDEAIETGSGCVLYDDLNDVEVTFSEFFNTYYNGQYMFGDAVYFNDLHNNTPLPFAPAQFDTMLGNLLSQNSAVISCQEIWDLWKTQVETYELWQGINWDEFTGDTPNSGYSFSYSLYENFIGQVNGLIQEKDPSTPEFPEFDGTDVFELCPEDAGMNYYVQRTSLYGHIGGTNIAPDLEQAHALVYYDERIEDHTEFLDRTLNIQGLTLDQFNGAAEISPLRYMTGCERFQMSMLGNGLNENENGLDDATLEEQYKTEVIGQCSKACELKSEAFRQALINDIFNTNPSATIEHYRVSFIEDFSTDPSGKIWSGVKDLTVNNDAFDYTECELDAMVKALIENCKTYCDIEYWDNPATGLRQLGTIEQLEAFKQVFHFDFNVEVKGVDDICGTGWDSIRPDIILSSQLSSTTSEFNDYVDEHHLMLSEINSVEVLSTEQQDSLLRIEGSILGLDAVEIDSFIHAHYHFHNEIQHLSNVNSSDIPINPVCTNMDFEEGNFNGWFGTLGRFGNSESTCPNCLDLEGSNPRHRIMTVSDGVDPIGGFPVVSPEGSFSVRLGNSNNGKESESLIQKFIVSEETSAFEYNIAVVLQDPRHPQDQQPFLTVEMLDSNQELIPCSRYNVIARQGIPGFESLGSVVYRPWFKNFIDLSDYIGQEVTLQFTTADCNYGAHYGYAYIDGNCLPSFNQITISNTDIYCSLKELKFQSSATGNLPNESFVWDFGDGNSSNEKEPTHIYASQGSYTVTLSILTDDTECQVREFKRDIDIESSAFDLLCFRWTNQLDFDLPGPFYEPVAKDCKVIEKDAIQQAIDGQKADFVNTFREERVAAYRYACTTPESLNDDLSLKYDLGLHHFTLYYYDRAGNLIKTVPPQGVNLLPVDDATSANLSRGSPTDHDLVTEYEYNSLGQLVQQTSPDGGTTHFLYNSIGQLRFSQNANQAKPEEDTYSYTKYDRLGRIIEVGQGVGFLANNVATKVYDMDYPASGTELTKTYYTASYPSALGSGRTQRYLRNRVSYTYLDEDGSDATLNDRTYTIYSYDPHGNVEWLVQSVPGLEEKLIEYEYDLISGNVLRVSYNPGQTDQFYHKYEYDGDNRIIAVMTSPNGHLWDTDATYEYYAHGPLKSATIGQDKVQQLDYVYTIHGWLKAINDPVENDIPDAELTGADAFAMALHYYSGDYQGTASVGSLTPVDSRDLYNGNIAAWEMATHASDDSWMRTGFQYTYDELNRIRDSRFNVFRETTNFLDRGGFHADFTLDANGNLRTLNRNNIDAVNFDALTYHYNITENNQLRGVTDAVSDTEIHPEDLETQPAANYSYDDIGNLTADAQAGTNIEWTVYGKVDQVIKGAGGTEFTYDAAGNRVKKHTTDEFGNTYSTFYIRDASGNIMSTYRSQTVGGVAQSAEVIEVPIYGSDRLGTYTPGGALENNQEPVAEITADQMVNSYEGVSYQLDDGVTLTLQPGFSYEDDIDGNNFTVRGSEAVDGSTPTDIYTRTLERKQYELKDHLGNVRTVVTDRKLSDISGSTAGNFRPQIASASAYYPYGMDMPTVRWEPETVTGTVEPENAPEEILNFDNYTDIDIVPDVNTSNNLSTRSFLLTGADGNIMGLAKSYKVQAGDKLNASVWGKYVLPNDRVENLNVATLLVNSFINTYGGAGFYEGQLLTDLSNAFEAGLASIVEDKEPNSEVTAGLSWLAFNNDFAFTGEGGFMNLSAAADGAYEAINITEHIFDEDGYVFVYTSNESVQTADVYFDDLTVTLEKLVPDEAYDPDLLAYRYGFNGKEKDPNGQNVEVVTSDLETCDFRNVGYCGWNVSSTAIRSIEGDKLKIAFTGCPSGCDAVPYALDHFATEEGKKYRVSFDFEIASTEIVEISIWSHKATGSAPLGPQEMITSQVFTSNTAPTNDRISLNFTAREFTHSTVYVKRLSPETLTADEFIYIDNFELVEITDEILKGSSLVTYDYGFRIYNPSVGRFLSVDPLTSSYPWYTPYQFAGNTPIQAIDLDGLEEYKIHSKWLSDLFYSTKRKMDSYDISYDTKKAILTAMLKRWENRKPEDPEALRQYGYVDKLITVSDPNAAFSVRGPLTGQQNLLLVDEGLHLKVVETARKIEESQIRTVNHLKRMHEILVEQDKVDRQVKTTLAVGTIVASGGSAAFTVGAVAAGGSLVSFGGIASITVSAIVDGSTIVFSLDDIMKINSSSGTGFLRDLGFSDEEINLAKVISSAVDLGSKNGILRGKGLLKSLKELQQSTEALDATFDIQTIRQSGEQLLNENE
ncbi:MAG: PKD domain-containing protein [Bacteroidota bacterium]